jgi:hypothetical protein
MAELDCNILVNNQADIVTSIGGVSADSRPGPGQEVVAESQLLEFQRIIAAIM